MRTLAVFLAVSALAVLPVNAQETREPTPEEKAVLERLEKEPLTLLDAHPQGAPDPGPWPGVTARFTSGYGNLKVGRLTGHPFAVVLVREGLCVDDEATRCYMSVLLDVSARRDAAKGTSDTVIRYSMLSHTGKRLNGFAWSHSENGSETYFYWVRRGEAWHQYAADTPEYQAEERFMNWLMQGLPHLDPKPKQTPAAKPGTKVDGTTSKFDAPHGAFPCGGTGNGIRSGDEEDT